MSNVFHAINFDPHQTYFNDILTESKTFINRNKSDECLPFYEFVEGLPFFSYMPSIQEVIFNGTHTVVKWNDGTTTVVNCIVEDDFNYEVGLAMAISRKYFEEVGYSDTPRAAFLNTIKNARIIEPKEK